MTKDIFISKVATSLRKIIARLPEDLDDRLGLLYDYLLPPSTLAYYTVPGIPAEFTFYEGFFYITATSKGKYTKCIRVPVPEGGFYPEAGAAPPAGGEEYAPTIVPTVDPYLDAGAGAAPPPPAHLFGAPPAGGEEYVPTIVPPEDLVYPYPDAGGAAHLPPAYCAGCARGCCTYYFA